MEDNVSQYVLKQPGQPDMPHIVNYAFNLRGLVASLVFLHFEKAGSFQEKGLCKMVYNHVGVQFIRVHKSRQHGQFSFKSRCELNIKEKSFPLQLDGRKVNQSLRRLCLSTLKRQPLL